MNVGFLRRDRRRLAQCRSVNHRLNGRRTGVKAGWQSPEPALQWTPPDRPTASASRLRDEPTAVETCPRNRDQRREHRLRQAV